MGLPVGAADSSSLGLSHRRPSCPSCRFRLHSRRTRSATTTIRAVAAARQAEMDDILAKLRANGASGTAALEMAQKLIGNVIAKQDDSSFASRMVRHLQKRRFVIPKEENSVFSRRTILRSPEGRFIIPKADDSSFSAKRIRQPSLDPELFPCCSSVAKKQLPIFLATITIVAPDRDVMSVWLRPISLTIL